MLDGVKNKPFENFRRDTKQTDGSELVNIGIVTFRNWHHMSFFPDAGKATIGNTVIVNISKRFSNDIGTGLVNKGRNAIRAFLLSSSESC